MRFRQVQPRDLRARLQNVGCHAIASIDARRYVALRKQSHEAIAHLRLNLGGGFEIRVPDPRKVRRKLDALGRSAHRHSIVRHDGLHTLGIQPPFGHQPVGRQAAVQRAFGNAIAIRNPPPRHGAKAHQVEVRVLRLQRIERPFDKLDPALQRIFSLKQLEPASNAIIAKFGQHGGHVRVKKRLAAAHADQRQRESEHPLAVKGAEHLSAGMVRHHKNRRHDGNVLAPRRVLDQHGLLEFFKGGAVAHDDLRNGARRAHFQ